MKRVCAVFGLSALLAAGLGGCAATGGPNAGVMPVNDAYASGKSNFAAGRLGLALMYFQQALQEQPSAERLNAVAATYDRLGRFDLADKYYRQALALDPKSAQTLNNMGYSYFLRGRADLAAAYLAKAHHEAMSDATISGNLALAMAAVEKPRVAARAQEPQPAAEPAPAAPAAPAKASSTEPAASYAPAEPTLSIEPVAKGVYRLVTTHAAVAESSDGDRPQVVAQWFGKPIAAPALLGPMPYAHSGPVVAERAPQTVPVVVEPMPAVQAVPVAAVVAEPVSPIQVAAAPRQPRMPEPTPPMRAIPVAAVAVEPERSSKQTVAGTAVDTVRSGLANLLIEVSNGSGIERSAGRFRTYLTGVGIPVRRLTNDKPFGYAKTVMFYRDGFLDHAKLIAAELPIAIEFRRNDRQRSDIRLRLGLDSKTFDGYLAEGILTASR